ncbi:MAG: hypothetical protein WB815_08470, partial [Nitrososphaeraceae archaeon]
VIDYYEAVTIACTESEHMQKYLDTPTIDVKEIDKTFKSIWEVTYKISGEEETRGILKNCTCHNQSSEFHRFYCKLS